MTTGDSSYLRRLGAFFGLGLACVVGLNAAVDPFASLAAPGVPGWNDTKTAARNMNVRSDKSVRLALGQYDAVVLGSSRARMAIDPEDPAFAGRRVYNAGLPAVSLPELEAVADFVLRWQSPELLLVGVDFAMASGVRQPGGAYRASGFGGAHPYGVLLGQLASWSTLSASVQTLRDNRSAVPATFLANGALPGPESRGPGRRPRESFDRTLSHYVANPDTYGCFAYDAARVAGIGRIAARARAGGARAIFYLSPIHAEQQALIHALGLEGALDRFRRDAAAAIAAEPPAGEEPWPLWDFTGYGRPNVEPVPLGRAAMRWYWESSHATRALGARMLERMLAPAAPARHEDGFGTRLRPESVDDWSAETRAAGQRWRDANPAVRRVTGGLARRHAAGSRRACAAHRRAGAESDEAPPLF